MEAETRRGLTLALVLFVVAFAIAVLWVRSANGEELKFGPGGCPTPWSVDWCVTQAGEDARGACSFGVPLPTKEGCLAKMKVVAKAATQAATARAKASRTETTTTGPRGLSVPILKRGMGPEIGGTAKWKAITGGGIGSAACPEWLAVLGNPKGCTRKINLSADDPAMDGPCGPNSGAAGPVRTDPEWVRARYGKPAVPPVGGFYGGNESFNNYCLFVGTRPVTPGYDGIPRHEEAYTCLATNCVPGGWIAPGGATCGANGCEPGESPTSCPADCAPPLPPKPCPNGKPDPGETCLGCPQDVGPCPPPVTPPVATSSAEAASWVERLALLACVNLAPNDGVSSVVCPALKSALAAGPWRPAVGFTFLRVRKLAREMTPRTYCLEIAGSAPRTVEVSGESGSFTVPAAGVVREGRCP